MASPFCVLIYQNTNEFNVGEIGGPEAKREDMQTKGVEKTA